MRIISALSPLFERAIESVFQNEGGAVNDPNDPGGATRYGISKRSYPGLDLDFLTKEQAKSIYYEDFWKPYPYDIMPWEDLAIKVFDLSVTMGSKKAHELLQQALNEMGKQLSIDGILGRETLQALKESSEDMIMEAFQDKAKNYYTTLCAKRPRLKKFLNGWLNRVAS